MSEFGISAQNPFKADYALTAKDRILYQEPNNY